MANLIDRRKPYLHSQKWTFFNYCNDNIPQLQQNNSAGATKSLQHLIKQLETLRDQAVSTEQQFYADFNAKDNFDWARKYLASTDPNASTPQKIQAIINSPEMIAILSGENEKSKNLTRAQQEKFIKSAIASAEKSVGAMANSPEFLQVLMTSARDISGDALMEIAKVLSPNDKDFKSFRAFEAQFLKDLSAGKRKYIPTLRAEYQAQQAKKIKESFMGLNDKNKRFARKKKAVEYLKEQLLRLGVPDDDVKQIAQNWQKILDGNDENATRLLSEGNTNIVGIVSEVDLTIAYIDISIDDSYNKTGINVKQFQYNGSSKVKRFGKAGSVSAKTDTIWTAPNGHTYNIQNKNSLTDLDTTDQIVNLKENVFGRPLELKLNDEVSLATLEAQLSASKVITKEDISLISYLLVNLNVLSKDGYAIDENGNSVERLYKGKGRGSNVPNAERTQQYVSQILSGAIQLFCSDFNDSSGKLEFSNTYSFIIYKGKYLIPMSDVYKSLIQSLQDYFNSVMRIWITSSLSGYSKQEFHDLYNRKREIIEKNPDEPYDYQNTDLVSEGKKEGEKVLNLIQMGAIRLKIFDPKNYLSQGYASTMRAQGLLKI